MQIDGLFHRDRVLSVKCSGRFGIGSEGNPSAELLKSSIQHWIDAHPGVLIEQLDIDYSKVEYSWGDGPLWSAYPLVRRGVKKIRLIASAQNQAALESLVTESRMPWFVVVPQD